LPLGLAVNIASAAHLPALRAAPRERKSHHQTQTPCSQRYERIFRNQHLRDRIQRRGVKAKKEGSPGSKAYPLASKAWIVVLLRY
jgi:hypothetical protein